MNAQFIIFEVRDRGRRGKAVWRGEVSTDKWGPGNAIETFVREKHPPAGTYLVAGDQGTYGSGGDPAVFSTYEVRYPDFCIEGTRAGGWQPYGDQSHLMPIAEHDVLHEAAKVYVREFDHLVGDGQYPERTELKALLKAQDAEVAPR